MAAQEIRVPDIGDFTDVPIIEIHVAAGDTVAVEDPLLTLESDKATLDVPSPVAGTVSALAVGVGDAVSEGTRDRDGRGRRWRWRGAHGARDRPDGRHGEHERSPRAGHGELPGDRGGAAGGPHRAGGIRVIGGGTHPRAGAGGAVGSGAAGRARALHRPEGRRARRGAGVRRRARRLHRGVPGGRPRQEGRAGGRSRPARRGVSERRLHPVQGAAARREGDRRDQGDERRTACRSPLPRSTSTRCAAGRTAWSPGSPAG